MELNVDRLFDEQYSMAILTKGSHIYVKGNWKDADINQLLPFPLSVLVIRN